MIFDGKPTAQITTEDIRRLIAEHVREDQFLDFKRDPYPANDYGRQELAKDVSAFANAAGGYIIVGVAENGEGRADALVGVTDAESVRRSMRDRCLTIIEPRLTELDIGIVRVDDRDIIVCRVPESPRKPHATVPDREHHSFWLRYQDGVKLMTVAEIRDAIAGDAVQREIAELRREMTLRREAGLIQDEREREVDERGLLQLQTPEAFAEHTNRLFRAEVGDRPYLRVTATPLPVAGRDIREHREAIARLMSSPPQYRPHGFGLRMGVADEGLRQTAAGLRRPRIDFYHLRLLWNGHLEYWSAADSDVLTWGMDQNTPPAERSFNPLVIIESTATFIRLAREVWTMAGIAGEAEFHLMLKGVRGRKIPPYADNTYGRLFGIHGLGDDTIGTFQDADLHIGPVREQIGALPGTVAFRLVSEVYYRLGYQREHIPYFDEQNRFMYDVEAERGVQGGQG
jgi:hypothetical protein